MHANAEGEDGRALLTHLHRKVTGFQDKELLIGGPLSEPQEPSLVDNIPEDLELMSVVINKFEDNDFYAKLRFSRGDKTRDFRVQLTEAMIASIRMEVPILVDESVLTKSGIIV